MQNLDEVIEKTKLERMLEFETQLFLDTVHKDGLVIAAKYVCKIFNVFTHFKPFI